MAGIGDPATPQKIAIVGDGMGALTAAYWLTDPSLGGRYEVTVYTMGWRLGGKGASGRNQKRNGRIEEHGLHIWFGTYHNAIALMRSCYAELGRPPGAPLATFDDAFKPQRRLVLLEEIAGQCRPWTIDCRDLPSIDGLTVLGLLRKLIGWLSGHVAGIPGFEQLRVADFARTSHPQEAAAIAAMAGPAGVTNQTARHLMDFMTGQIQFLEPGAPGAARQAGVLSGALRLLARNLFLWLKPLLPQDDPARRIWILTYLGITFARGMLDDQLYEKGFDAVEGIEMRDWLAKHSSFDPSDNSPLADQLAFFSACMQAFYDASFSYVDGDATQPNVAASVALRCMLRISFDYAGPIILEMQAGMGDTVFTPLYLVLKQRGVRIAFFHRLTNLQLDPDGKSIAGMTFSRQVQIPDATAYEPLITVNNLACWPSDPLFAQITDGAALCASGANIEHWNSGWTDTGGEVSLARGVDFEHVVLGISYDVLPEVTRELATDPRWRAMIGGLDTADTQAAQLWFAADRAELGMDATPEIFGGYFEPWSSLVDFSHLLPREAWPSGAAPRYLNYTCGPLAKQAEPGNDAVYIRLRDFLNADAAPLWPNAVGAAGFKYDLLYADPALSGEDRLKAQYWRANTDPTERYVIAKANTASVRLQPGQTGFDNLSIAGEWADSGVNISSIEATVITGMRVSRALTGEPQRIAGEKDL